MELDRQQMESGKKGSDNKTNNNQNNNNSNINTIEKWIIGTGSLRVGWASPPQPPLVKTSRALDAVNQTIDLPVRTAARAHSSGGET